MNNVVFWTLAFWACETVFFLIRDGWHWKAISKAEIYCDFLVSIGYVVGILLFIRIIMDVIETFIIIEDKLKEDEI